MVYQKVHLAYQDILTKQVAAACNWRKTDVLLTETPAAVTCLRCKKSNAYMLRVS